MNAVRLIKTGSSHRCVSWNYAFAATSSSTITAQRDIHDNQLSQSCKRYLSTERRQKKALVIGSSGALGSAVCQHLSEDLQMKVLGADIVQRKSNKPNLDGFIKLDEKSELPELTHDLVIGVHNYLKAIEGVQGIYSEDGDDLSGLDCVVVASGGWEGDPPMEPVDKKSLLPQEQQDFLSDAVHSYTDTVMRMRKMNLDPVVAASFVAQHMCTDESPLMVVMGAMAAVSPAPGMMGYGLAKSATHFMVQTMGAMNGNRLENRALRKRGFGAKPPHLFPFVSVVGLLPTTIDTPSNRKAMPNGKFEQWTKPRDIALEIGKWVERPPERPASGSLVRVFSRPGEEGAELELVY